MSHWRKSFANSSASLFSVLLYPGLQNLQMWNCSKPLTRLLPSHTPAWVEGAHLPNIETAQTSSAKSCAYCEIKEQIAGFHCHVTLIARQDPAYHSGIDHILVWCKTLATCHLSNANILLTLIAFQGHRDASNLSIAKKIRAKFRSWKESYTGQTGLLSTPIAYFHSIKISLRQSLLPK